MFVEHVLISGVYYCSRTKWYIIGIETTNNEKIGHSSHTIPSTPQLASFGPSVRRTDS